MPTKKTVTDNFATLIRLRNLLGIDFIYFNINEEGIHRIEIKPSDKSRDLTELFTIILSHYEKALESLKKSKSDLSVIQGKIESEIQVIDEIIHLQDAEDVLSYFSPIYFEVFASDNFKAPSNPDYVFTAIEKKYIWDHYVIRRIYFKQMAKLLKETLVDLNDMMKKLKLVKPASLSNLDKILTEFWYLLEKAIYKQDLNEKELSVLRYQYFSLFGSSDRTYSKYKSEINARNENYRFSDLSKLINKGTLNLLSIDARRIKRLKQKSNTEES